MFKQPGFAVALYLSASFIAARPACGQESAALPADSFPSSYFAGDSVSNAYEMLQRVPGFTIVEADEDARGYAASLGNVLVDGIRPSSKRESVVDILKRIPATAVHRIDLLHVGAAGVDLGGFPVVANVVRERVTTMRAAIEAGVAAATDGWSGLPVEAQYSLQKEDRGLDLALTIEPELDDDTGRGEIHTFGSGNEAPETELWDTWTHKKLNEVTGVWRQPVVKGDLVLAAALRREVESVGTVTSHAGETGTEAARTSEGETATESEIGARYELSLREGTNAKLIASTRHNDLERFERSLEEGTNESFDEQTESGEDIWRVELDHDHDSRFGFTASFETTRNALASDSQLLEDGEPVAVPGSDVDISELRREAAIGVTASPGDEFSIEAAFRFEWSTITQLGDSPLRRDFTYPKPRVAMQWTPSPDDNWRLSISREVGQLDFEDFVASASLENDVVTAGNAALVPEQTWRLAAEWEHRFNADSSITLGWTYERIKDVVDRILVTTPEDEFDAPGNIGDGLRNTFSLQYSAALVAMGISGGRIRAVAQVRDSQVTDPVTGETRGISEEKPIEAEIEFTQELPAWQGRWGLLVEHIGERETKYRFDEIENKSEDTGWTLYLERMIGTSWRMHAEVTDLFGRRFKEVRDSYGGARSDAPLEEREIRRRTSPGVFVVTIRRSFGN